MSGPVYEVLKEFVRDSFGADLDNMHHRVPRPAAKLVAGANTIAAYNHVRRHARGGADPAAAAADGTEDADADADADEDAAEDADGKTDTSKAGGSEHDETEAEATQSGDETGEGGTTNAFSGNWAYVKYIYLLIYASILGFGYAAHTSKHDSPNFTNYVTMLMFALMVITIVISFRIGLNTGEFGGRDSAIPIGLYCLLTLLAYAFVFHMARIVIPESDVDAVNKANEKANERICAASPNKTCEEKTTCALPVQSKFNEARSHSIALLFFLSFGIACIPIFLLMWNNRGVVKIHFHDKIIWTMLLCTLITIGLNIFLTVIGMVHNMSSGTIVFLVVKDILIFLIFLWWYKTNKAAKASEELLRITAATTLDGKNFDAVLQARCYLPTLEATAKLADSRIYSAFERFIASIPKAATEFVHASDNRGVVLAGGMDKKYKT